MERKEVDSSIKIHARKSVLDVAKQLNYIGHRYDKSSPVYKPANYFIQQCNRYVRTLEMLATEGVTSGRILEIGVVPGHFHMAMKNFGLEPYGIDLEPKRLPATIDRNRITSNNVEHETCDFNANFFDAILMPELIEHLRQDPLHCLQECHRMLKPGGKLIITTPNRSRLKSRIKLLIWGDPDIESPYKAFKRVHDYGHAGHIRLYTEGEILEMLLNTNLTPVKAIYFDFKNEFFGQKSPTGLYDTLSTGAKVKKVIWSLLHPKRFAKMLRAFVQWKFPSLDDRLCVIASKPK